MKQAQKDGSIDQSSDDSSWSSELSPGSLFSTSSSLVVNGLQHESPAVHIKAVHGAAKRFTMTSTFGVLVSLTNRPAPAADHMHQEWWVRWASVNAGTQDTFFNFLAVL